MNICWLLPGAGEYILAADEWRWVIAGSGGWWWVVSKFSVTLSCSYIMLIKNNFFYLKLIQ